MKLSLRYIAPIFTALLASTASAQWVSHELSNVELGGGAIGQFTPVLPTHNGGARQTTSDSFGGEFSLKAHPFAWAGVEVNYGYTKFHEQFATSTPTSTTTASFQTHMHEVTGAYLFHPHIRHLQPFVAIGGGAIDFVPVNGGANQWRGTGLVETGFDIPTSNKHWGFRVQGRGLFYRQPQFYFKQFGKADWVATVEPMVGVWYRR